MLNFNKKTVIMIREVFTFLFLVTTCMSVLPNSNRVLCIESSTEQLVDSVSTSTRKYCRYVSLLMHPQGSLDLSQNSIARGYNQLIREHNESR